MVTLVPLQTMQARAFALRGEGKRIGFVPTMGYLHAGHVSLLHEARKHADIVVVSIFVNPTQFGPNEDFERYPRDMARDAALCRDAGVDILFAPEAVDMYPVGWSVFVDETRLSAGLCGASRPGHFRGVMTVVAKLFNIVQPHVAVFGEKDYQQARIVRQLVRDLNFAVEVVVAPTVREADGLAMSSRNTYLSPEHRSVAPRIRQALLRAQDRVRLGERDVVALARGVRSDIEQTPLLRAEYIEIVDADTLAPIARLEQRAVAAVAVRAGATRLIDNVELNPPSS